MKRPVHSDRGYETDIIRLQGLTSPRRHRYPIESFFARVKRGLNGTYHAVSKEHLHRYISQYEWLYNTRGMNDGERTLALLKRVEGKRLIYKQSA